MPHLQYLAMNPEAEHFPCYGLAYPGRGYPNAGLGPETTSRQWNIADAPWWSVAASASTCCHSDPALHIQGYCTDSITRFLFPRLPGGHLRSWEAHSSAQSRAPTPARPFTSSSSALQTTLTGFGVSGIEATNPILPSPVWTDASTRTDPSTRVTLPVPALNEGRPQGLRKPSLPPPKQRPLE